jgi:heat shock protein 1/8
MSEMKSKQSSEVDDFFRVDSDTDISYDSDDDSKEDIDKEEVPEIIVGIDLGTTNSCIGVWRNKNLEIIPDPYGNRTIPSIVSFTNRSKYVGRDAKNQLELNPENTYYEVKRLIGRNFNDQVVINDAPFRTYEIAESKADSFSDKEDSLVLKSTLDGRKSEYTPEEISAAILTELKLMAEDYLKQPVEKAVITVPAYFNDSQRQATKDAATIAGLDCVRIINEPTAAALAYGLERITKNKEEDLNIVVYDIGGGTLDCSLLNISNGLFEVLASTGNTHLGGVDFDNRLVSYCRNQFKKEHKINKLKQLSLLSCQKLRKSCENAKKMLSETGKAIIAVKDFYKNKNLLLQITRKQFEKLCQDLFILCLKPIEDVLKSADVDIDEVDEIILVGGATRMPSIRNNIKLFFKGKEPNCSVNPDEVVAAGAALQGYILANKLDPFSESVVLLDVIPLSLGVETINGVMNTIIPRNSVIPISSTKKFTTAEDNDTFVNVKVYEGERAMTIDNFLVGKFKLQGLEPAPRGMATINITFNIDINGIISVTAEDIDNKDNKNAITITGNKGRLSVDVIRKLVLEAKDMEKKDKITREKKQLYYEIEEHCSNIKTNIDEDNCRLKLRDKEIIQEDVDNIFKWLEEKDCFSRTPKEYLSVIKRLKKKYGTLILKISKGDDSTIKATNQDGSVLTGTTIYGDTEETVYEELENKELGFTEDMDDDEKQDIKKIRESLKELCTSVLEVINSDTLSIKNEHIKELKNYIDDIMLWMYVAEKISKLEYKHKIDEINKACEKVLSEYAEEEVFEQNEVLKQIKTKRNELEQLCYAIKSSIISNVFSLDEENIRNLDEEIDNIFEWLLEIDVNNRKAELKKETNKDITEENYQLKIDNVNDLCNNLYNSMVGVNVTAMNEDVIKKDNVIILGQSTNECLIGGNEVGTTIESLLADSNLKDCDVSSEE